MCSNYVECNNVPCRLATKARHNLHSAVLGTPRTLTMVERVNLGTYFAGGQWSVRAWDPEDGTLFVFAHQWAPCISATARTMAAWLA